MAYVIKKRGKFMEGHSYSTLLGYRFYWTRDIGKAQRFADDDPAADIFSNRTGGKIIHDENTKRELKELGRRALK